MARSSSVPPSIGSSRTSSRLSSSPTAVAAGAPPAPVPPNVPRGVFFPPAARTVNQPGMQSPFMYAGFRANAPQPPAYMGFGAQKPAQPVFRFGNSSNRTAGTTPNVGSTLTTSVAPRAGGIYNAGEIWTGGSTITPTGRPVALNCFRPKDLRERLKIQDNLVAGLSEEMKMDMPSDTDNSAYSITRSIGELKLELERCGLDNPFRIVLSPTEEIYLLENWGGVTIADVKYWCTQLDNTGCEFDAENLRLSAIKIKGSLGAALSARVATVTEADTPGPVLFKVAVDQVASLSAAKVRKLTNDLQGLSLKNVPGQSVPVLTKTLTELTRQIDFSGVGPADLTSLVSKVYTTGTDTGFNHHAWGVYNSISTGFDHRPWREIVEGLVSFYEQQIQLDLYVPALGKKDPDQSIHGLLSAQMDRLEKKFDNAVSAGGTSNTGGTTRGGPTAGGTGRAAGTDTRRCFKCNAIGHLSKDCPSPKALDPLHTPPNTKKGDPRERVRNGTTERWCGRCRGGKGIWTQGSDLHYTEDHPKSPPDSSPPVPTPSVAAAEANLGFIDAPFHFGFLGVVSPSSPDHVSSSGPSPVFVDGVKFFSVTDYEEADEEPDQDTDTVMPPKAADGEMSA